MLKASKHEADSEIRSRRGPSQTTTSIGRRCKHGDMLSRAVLIARCSVEGIPEKSLDSVERDVHELFSRLPAVSSSEPYSGDDSIRAPPLPIPNREVKPYHADGTAKAEE